MRQRANTFPDRVRSVTGYPSLFEIIPPLRDAPKEKVDAWRDRILAAVGPRKVDALNIPEVRDESRSGERTYEYARRMKPREFARLFLESRPETSQGPLNVVINRVVVYRTVKQQKVWLRNSHKLGIRNLILVGGESSRATYPGPSVARMAELIREEINSQLDASERFFCGGITIPTRRRSDPERDEPWRLVQKIKSGLEYFSSQIIYEADKTCRLLADYAEACAQENVKPARIFLSFAPVGRPKHIEFLRWLGVEVPPGTEAELLADPQQIGARSLAICQRLWEQIQDFVGRQSLPVPLGFNISPLMRPNFDLGVELLDRLT